ncbi:hypothetical protein [Paraburkholderia youngii]|uniref:Uncharacterized protein n=1 Tax=Paraburkholderia youngii TaxID=2782701 RepID=A0A7Y6MXZ1_9BURK|nr:hypothetical protein [Paraburkholderia youngii]NUX98758.1 hypothetical protein [Paraburkholderia youngii]
MRQDQRTNVPEVGEPYHPFQVQGKGDGWAVFDASTGGWTRVFDTYKEAQAKAKSLFEDKQRQAVANIDAFYKSRTARNA